MNKINRMAHGEKPGPVIKKGSTIISNQGGLSGAEKPFDAMNSIVANLLLNITRYKNTLLCCFVILVRHHSSITQVFLCASILFSTTFALGGHMLHNTILFHKVFPYRFFKHFLI